MLDILRQISKDLIVRLDPVYLFRISESLLAQTSFGSEQLGTNYFSLCSFITLWILRFPFELELEPLERDFAGIFYLLNAPPGLGRFLRT